MAEAAIQTEMTEVLARPSDDRQVEVPTPLPSEAPTLLVGADGARVFQDKDWREVKIGVVCELGPDRRRHPKTGRDFSFSGRASTWPASRMATRSSPALPPGSIQRAIVPVAQRPLMIGDRGPWVWARSLSPGVTSQVASLMAPGSGEACHRSPGNGGAPSGSQRRPYGCNDRRGQHNPP